MPKLTRNPFGLMATPAPAPADIAADHAEALSTLDFDNVIAALPNAIGTAMQTALPGLYTPERAAQFAAAMADQLREQHNRPLTAAARGTEWMLRWGCTDFCIIDHTDPHAPDWHSAGPAATELRATDLDYDGHNEDRDTLPWLSAETVVTCDKPQAYGRETRVLLGYGVHLAELSPARARQALEAMRGFVEQLAAVVDDADRVALDDFAGDPEIAQADCDAEAARRRRITEGRA